MRHFQRIAQGLDVLPIGQALARQPALWTESTLASETFKQDAYVTLRFCPQGSDVPNELDCVAYPAMAALPQVRPIVLDLMRRVEGERLGRILITRLPPGQMIGKHRDEGAYADYYSRYHIALASDPGVVFTAGAESVYMATGDVWWFDHKQEHEIKNGSGGDRITLIVDIRALT